MSHVCNGGFKTGNRKVNPPDFRWIYLNQITDIQTPEDVIVLEQVGEMPMGFPLRYALAIPMAL